MFIQSNMFVAQICGVVETVTSCCADVERQTVTLFTEKKNKGTQNYDRIRVTYIQPH